MSRGTQTIHRNSEEVARPFFIRVSLGAVVSTNRSECVAHSTSTSEMWKDIFRESQELGGLLCMTLGGSEILLTILQPLGGKVSENWGCMKEKARKKIQVLMTLVQSLGSSVPEILPLGSSVIKSPLALGFLKKTFFCLYGIKIM